MQITPAKNALIEQWLDRAAQPLAPILDRLAPQERAAFHKAMDMLEAEQRPHGVPAHPRKMPNSGRARRVGREHTMAAQSGGYARRLTGSGATLSDHPPTPLDVTDWVWAAGGGGDPDRPHHQCPLAGTDVPAYQPCADLPLGGCREIVRGVCGLSRRVSGYR